MAGPPPFVTPPAHGGPPGETLVVGKRVRRVDAVEKVAGSAIFGADVPPPVGTLHARLCLAEVSHGTIRRIDVSRAVALKGVRAVVTEADFTDALYGMNVADQPPMARGKVRYYGEPIAAVAADTEAIAEEAVELIEVEYDPLPIVLDPVQTDDAPRIHENPMAYRRMGPPKAFPGNVMEVTRIENGDVDAAFAQAHRIYEHTVRTQVSHHGYIEPHAALAVPDPTGKLTVWSPTQAVFPLRESVARSIGVPASRVRVVGTYIGGGFGGKVDPLLEPIIARLAQKTGRPVRAVVGREVDFLTTFTRGETVIRVRTAVDASGQMIAREGEVILGAGAFAGLGPMEMTGAVQALVGPYHIPNVRLLGKCVYTNKQNSQMVRGPGGPQSVFAIETQADIIARDFGIDPIEFRRRHGVKSGQKNFVGLELHHVALDETIEAAARRAGPPPERNADGRLRGRGFAIAEWHSGMLGSGAFVKLNGDGTAAVLNGTSEIGAGEATTVAQLVAEELGLAVEDITVHIADTDLVPYDAGVFGSRSTHSMGLAVQKAAREVRQRILDLAARRLEANPDDLILANRMVSVKGSPDRALPVAAIAGMASFVTGPIGGTGANSIPPLTCDPTFIKEGSVMGAAAHTYGAQVVDVEIDPGTGQVYVTRLVAAHDVGKAINPVGVEGQIEGGAAMGVGYALTEVMHYDAEGRLQNPNLLDYKMLTALDTPPIEPVIVEIFDPYGGPFGAKGVGEPPIIPTAAAIANAIYDATGAMITELPITPERVRSAIKATAGR